MDHTTVDHDTLDAGALAKRDGDGLSSRPEPQRMCFGAYSVCPSARALKLGATEVPLGSRAFDLLVVLLRSRGRLVAKDEIVREVWPSTLVDESNLRFQMGVLRKALGPERDRIKTIPGRGYIFVDDDGASARSDSLRRPQVPRAGMAVKSFILIVEPNAEERSAMTTLLRALKISVLSFKSVEEVAAFTVSSPRLVPV